MPTVMAHAVAGTGLAYIMNRDRKSWIFFFAAIFCSILPDLDMVAFSFGIPYHHPLGHRGFSHSIALALGVGLVLALLWRLEGPSLKKRFRYGLTFFLVTLLHGVLDAMTTGGLGIGFLIPLNEGRYFLPWRVIKVSPFGVKAFLSDRGIAVLKSEFRLVWVPTLVLVSLTFLWRRLSSRRDV